MLKLGFNSYEICNQEFNRLFLLLGLFGNALF